LAERPKKKKLFAQSEARPVELFKLHLGNMSQDKKPRLPRGLDYRKAIKDYLKKLNEVGNDHTYAHVLEIMRNRTERNMSGLYAFQIIK